jgi:hypothetical protein
MLDRLVTNPPGWAYRGRDRSINDQMQTFVFLQAV